MLMVKQSGHYLVKCWCHSHWLFGHSPGGENWPVSQTFRRCGDAWPQGRLGFLTLEDSPNQWWLGSCDDLDFRWIFGGTVSIWDPQSDRKTIETNQKDKKHICPMSKGTAYRRLIFNIPWWVSGVVTPRDPTYHVAWTMSKVQRCCFFCWGSLWTFGCWNNFSDKNCFIETQ